MDIIEGAARDIYMIKNAGPLDIATFTWRQFLTLVTELPP